MPAETYLLIFHPRPERRISLIQKFYYFQIKLLGQLYLSLLHRKDKEERMETETIASGQDLKSGFEKKESEIRYTNC
jgi:hypothetical protein